MKNGIAVLCLLSLAGCASSSLGVVPASGSSYTVSESKAVFGIGYSESAKESVQTQAEKFCSTKGGQKVESLDFKQTPSALGQAATATLTFKCV